MASQPQSPKIPWYLLVIFALLCLGILLIGYFYYDYQVQYVRQDKQDDLAAILKLKTEQIVYWRQERFNDARVIFSDQFLALKINDYFQRKAPPALEQEISNRLAALLIHQYKKIILIGAQGEVELTIPAEPRPCDSYTRKLVADASLRKEIIFSDLYRDDVSQEIRLSLLVPVLLPADKSLVGVLLLKVDPNQFLYPLIQAWPSPSRTAETELLRRDGNQVVFLNELRRREGAALSLRFPLAEPNLCSAMITQGAGGVVEGQDYRGRRVLAAGAPIPGSPWFLLVKMDRSEIFAPLADYMRQTALLVLALVLSAGIGVAFIWRNQQAGFYRRQLEGERDKLVLAQRYEYLTKYANEIILLADQDLRILEANHRAEKTYGYDKAELLGLNLRDLQPPETQALLEEQLRQAREQEGVVYETTQQRKDGTTFPVEMSLSFVEMGGHKIYQEIIRDITVRAEAQSALLHSQASLAEAQRIAHLGSWEWDVLADATTWSEEVYRIYGRPHLSAPPSYEEFVRCVHPDDQPRVKTDVAAALKGEKQYRLSFRIVRPDGSVRVLYNEAEVTRDAAGRPVRLMGIVQDVTERAQTEKALRASEKNLRHLASQLLTAQETERRRIALVLHDDLGQALMLFKFQLATLKEKLQTEKSPLSVDSEELLHYLKGLIGKLRELSRELSPPTVLEELGLTAALRFLIEQFGKHYAISQSRVELADIDELFSKPVQINIYRIVQECLTNIGRHAQATGLSIKIERTEDYVAFSIEDNGRGFDVEEALGPTANKAGVGIPAMTERVKIVGGTIAIRSQIGSGTSITFRIPVI